MDVLSFVQVAVGIAILLVGGEGLVRGASGLATKAGMSPLVVGLTVVAFATSSPELAVSVNAALSGEPELAVGNVVGSNIANVLLVLGTAAVVAALAVKSQLVRVDIPLMLAFSVALYVMSLDGVLSAGEGVILLVALVAYLVQAVLLGRRSQPGRPEPPAAEPVEPPAAAATSSRPPWLRGDSLLVDLLLLGGGVVLLVWGSDRLVAGATSIATSLGVSSLVVGLTVVAFGTSMPELATSVVATRRGERDLAIGNVVGSNIFNIAFVLGLPAVIGPGGGIPIPDAAIAFDIPFMVAVALVLLPVAFHGSSIDRWEGVLFLGIYAAFLTYLVLAGTQHDSLDQFTGVMWSFVVPLLALTLVGLVVTEVRRRGRELS